MPHKQKIYGIIALVVLISLASSPALGQRNSKAPCPPESGGECSTNEDCVFECPQIPDWSSSQAKWVADWSLGGSDNWCKCESDSCEPPTRSARCVLIDGAGERRPFSKKQHHKYRESQKTKCINVRLREEPTCMEQAAQECKESHQGAECVANKAEECRAQITKECHNAYMLNWEEAGYCQSLISGFAGHDNPWRCFNDPFNCHSRERGISVIEASDEEGDFSAFE